jgi:hypothetical protein
MSRTVGEITRDIEDRGVDLSGVDDADLKLRTVHHYGGISNDVAPAPAPGAAPTPGP